MTILKTAPSFVFDQGCVHDGFENPIEVTYYDNDNLGVLIELTQENKTINFSNLKILKSLIREIERHHERASKALNK